MILKLTTLLYGAFSNSCIRGASIDSLFTSRPKLSATLLKYRIIEKDENNNLTLRHTKFLNALGFSLFAFLNTLNVPFAILMFFGMCVSQAFSIFKNRIDVFYQQRKYLECTYIVMCRAFFWALPLVLITWLFFGIGSALMWLILIPAMPLSYAIMFCEYLSDKANRWGWAEAIFGPFAWYPLITLSSKGTPIIYSIIHRLF